MYKYITWSSQLFTSLNKFMYIIRNWIWCHHHWNNNYGSVTFGSGPVRQSPFFHRPTAYGKRNKWSTPCGKKDTNFLWSWLPLFLKSTNVVTTKTTRTFSKRTEFFVAIWTFLLPADAQPSVLSVLYGDGWWIRHW